MAPLLIRRLQELCISTKWFVDCKCIYDVFYFASSLQMKQSVQGNEPGVSTCRIIKLMHACSGQVLRCVYMLYMKFVLVACMLLAVLLSL